MATDTPTQQRPGTGKGNRARLRRAARMAVAAALLALTVASCARMGQPDGGWYDDTPPRITVTSPKDKATNVTARKIHIYFDEYIKLEDASNKVVVSPPQVEMPEIKTAGKEISIELKDSLRPDMTYTIDFSDAISDNNEGNPMGNYTYSFSTGERIDTFEVSGNVIDASNLEPIKGILVGLYANLSDTAFTTTPLLRVARTDSRGHFVIKGVAPGTYRAYALQDADGNYMYSQKSEMVAFNTDSISPSCGPDIRQDTIWRDSLRIDSIIRTGYTHFYPDDIVLRAFSVPLTDRYLIKTERQSPEKIGIYFSYGSDTLPAMRGLNFDAEKAFIVESTEKHDTITYWIKDTALVNKDTLQFALTYMMTDTAGVLVSNTDTISAVPRMSYEKRMKQRQKEFEDWQKEQEKAKKKGEPYDSVMPPAPLVPKISAGTSLDPDRNIAIEMPSPLARCDTAAIHLYSKHDTLWYRSRFELRPVPGKLRAYTLLAEWRPGIEYSLEIDSAAFEDIYGLVSNAYKAGIRVRAMDEYSSLTVNLTGTADTAIIVQLLNGADGVVKQTKASGGSAEFFYVNPGTYYLRAFADTNGNGTWDTGDYHAGRQPETVTYYPKKIECKEKWDVTIGWNMSELPGNRQKPMDITKQKPEQERKLRNRNADRARDLGIEYIKPN